MNATLHTMSTRVHIRRCWTLVITIAALVVAPRGSVAQETAWHIGPAFQRQLQTKMSLVWKEAPLGPRLENFAKTQRICIWLDRRVDPSQRVEAAYADLSVLQTIEQLSQQLQLGTCLVGSVVYIGPRETAERLSTHVLKAGRDLPTAARGKLARQTSATWPMLTTPREALQGILEPSQLVWKSLDRVPHDLLPARKLPPLAIRDQAALLLAGFDLALGWQNGPVIQPLGDDTISRTYSVPNSRASALAKVLAQHPDAKVERKGSRHTVRGSGTLHRKIEGALATGKPMAADPQAKTLYTLAITDKPLGALLKTIATRLGRELKPAANVDLNQRISIEFREASLEEMLSKIEAKAIVQIRVDEQAMHVSGIRD